MLDMSKQYSYLYLRIHYLDQALVYMHLDIHAIGCIYCLLCGESAVTIRTFRTEVVFIKHNNTKPQCTNKKSRLMCSIRADR